MSKTRFVVTLMSKNMKTLYDFGDKYIGAKNGCLFLCDQHSEKKICHLPMSRTMRFLCHFRLAERILRIFPRWAIAIDQDTLLVSFLGGIYNVQISTGNILCEHKYTEGMNNSLYITWLESEVGCSPGFYYGEYTAKRIGSKVAIWFRTLNSDQWKCVYHFEKDAITHIHALVPDVYRKRVLILTGDANDEVGIWATYDNFQHVKKLVWGEQRYRACVAVAIDRGIVYATDSPTEKNALYLLCNDNDLLKIADLPGSVIYGQRYKNKLVISTTVEPDSRVTGKEYLFTRKLGKGIEDTIVRIYACDLVTLQLEEVWHGKKDFWPMGLCQFGTVTFANYDTGVDRILASPMAVKKSDNNVLILQSY